jgi:uncharacterized membrane protein YjfL (UPF0719 family)
MKTHTKLDAISLYFGIAAAVAIVFNTVLALVKDGYKPLEKGMANITGHHWITHGIVDLLVFIAIGIVLLKMRKQINEDKLPNYLIYSVVTASFGLLAWFFIV